MYDEADRLKKLAVETYGRYWQAALARATGISSRHMRRFAAGGKVSEYALDLIATALMVNLVRVVRRDSDIHICIEGGTPSSAKRIYHALLNAACDGKLVLYTRNTHEELNSGGFGFAVVGPWNFHHRNRGE